jgi:hypothetical protein
MTRACTDVRVGRVDGRFICEVVDTALWVARQLSWDIEFVRTPSGFIARIRL